MITTSQNRAPCISPPSRGLTHERLLSLLQISTNDTGAGAEKVAWNFFRGYREAGYRSWLAVGTKRGDDPDVLQIPRVTSGPSSRYWYHMQRRLDPFQGRSKFVSRPRPHLRMLANPRHELQSRLGLEDFEFPREVSASFASHRPDIVHCHKSPRRLLRSAAICAPVQACARRVHAP